MEVEALKQDDLDEQRARLEAKAVRMSHNGTMSVDEFVGWYHDPDVRKRIFTAAKLCEDNVNTAKDLRQDAWAEICQLPPDSPREAVLAAAKRTINTIYQRDRRRRKKVQIILDAEL